MATIAKRRVRLELEWNKNDPTNFSWRAIAWGYVSDDAKRTGEEELMAVSDQQIITRAQFRGLTGAQIEDAVANAADEALQALGTGAGSHVINADLGD